MRYFAHTALIGQLTSPIQVTGKRSSQPRATGRELPKRLIVRGRMCCPTCAKNSIRCVFVLAIGTNMG